MDRVFIYQGSFENLLTLIDYLIKNKIRPFNIKTIDYDASLLEEIVDLKLQDREEIINYWFNKDKRILKIMYYLYLSSDKNKELIIYYFYLNALKYSDTILLKRNLRCVDEALKISHYVSREAHKLKGFLRFRELKNNVLYAKFEATNNCLPILARYFKERLKNEYWIIHDVKRGNIIVYDKKNSYELKAQDLKIEKINKEEKYEDLWQVFFKTIAIEARENRRCQRNFMPKKYWKYLLEMRDENEISN